MARVSLSNQVLDNRVESNRFVKRGKPRWLRAQAPQGEGYSHLLQLVRRHNLHTVCEEASCPNMGECWSAGVATIMILGEVCTRSCGFCHIKTGKPPELDEDEPDRVAEAVRLMGLNYIVITSVNRDELPDGGAAIWARTIRLVLISDFCGDWEALQTVLDARPDVLNHNLETVRRLYPAVRPQAKYDRSIELLRRSREQGLVTKTGIMVGIGERDDEVEQLMADVLDGTRSGATAGREAGACDILTIGQYLQPSPAHLPVHRFVPPQTFTHYKAQGEAMGLVHVESGPMVRSSYHADRQAVAAQTAAGSPPRHRSGAGRSQAARRDRAGSP
ncbi:MAG: lipoyl synthase [Planctomycetes bacterium]|jgi:lipoic acid synthetase|nr:lipoyl synthase [Planctomycetota bacterium]